ncbi:MAG: hypothetical protein ACP5O8_02070 [Candidatus Aenigmatarchaeota archaeon]
MEKQYQELIEFSHLNVTPTGAFSLAFLATLVTVVVPTTLIIVLNLVYPALFILIGIFAAVVFYFLYDYPMHYAAWFRINASSEMTLCILFMATSMRITPTLEKAIDYAAKNLRGALAYDLKLLMWEIYSRKYTTEEAIEKFIEKWKKDNQEFTEALYLIKNASLYGQTEMERILDEAVSVMLEGTKDRMKTFARELNTPITIINALGILLPLIGVVFFPIMSLFLPEFIQPLTIAIGYDIILPLVVYWLMKMYLDRRPSTFHQPDISKHPKFKKEKLIDKTLTMSLFVGGILCFYGFLGIVSIEAAFSPEQLYASLLVTLGIGLAFSIYMILSTRDKIKLREEIITIESEFPEAIFQIGNRLRLGVPLEKVFSEVLPKIKNLKVSQFIKEILQNIENFGVTLEQAVFDERYGAILKYPSTLIETVMRALVEIQKKGSLAISKTMLTISTYLKNVHSVEESLKDLMSEITSSLKIQALLLAPLTGGIVVALAAIIMQLLVVLENAELLYKQVEGFGPLASAGKGILSSFISLDSMIPVHLFQITIGIYIIEIIALMSIFSSIIENGEENIIKRSTMGKRVLIGVIFYLITLIIIYSLFMAMVPSELA